jgi:hypothetical protein
MVPVHWLGVVLVEIPRVVCALQVWYNGTLHLAVVQRIPVNVLEPGVRFYRRSAA